MLAYVAASSSYAEMSDRLLDKISSLLISYKSVVRVRRQPDVHTQTREYGAREDKIILSITYFLLSASE